MRTICAAFLVMLLMLTPLLVTDVSAMELGDVDVVWAGWEQDTGPPVVVVDGDNLGTRSIEENTTGTHKPTVSLSDGTADGRMVTAWRVGIAGAGQDPTKS